MRHNTETRTIFVEKIIKETDLAIKVLYEEEEIWLPFSQILEIHHEDPIRIVITAWIAKEKGI